MKMPLPPPPAMAFMPPPATYLQYIGYPMPMPYYAPPKTGGNQGGSTGHGMMVPATAIIHVPYMYYLPSGGGYMPPSPWPLGKSIYFDIFFF